MSGLLHFELWAARRRAGLFEQLLHTLPRHAKALMRRCHAPFLNGRNARDRLPFLGPSPAARAALLDALPAAARSAQAVALGSN